MEFATFCRSQRSCSFQLGFIYRVSLGFCLVESFERAGFRVFTRRCATIRNVRNRSREGRMAVPKFCKRGHFWRFPASRSFVSRGRRGTSWHSNVCRTVSKIVLCGRRNTLATFSEDASHFPGERDSLEIMIVILRGRRSTLRTLDVSCGSFFANRFVRAASNGDKVQIPWQARHFVRCAENWRKPRTKHRFWGSKFSGSKENS